MHRGPANARVAVHAKPGRRLPLRCSRCASTAATPQFHVDGWRDGAALVSELRTRTKIPPSRAKQHRCARSTQPARASTSCTHRRAMGCARTLMHHGRSQPKDSHGRLICFLLGVRTAWRGGGRPLPPRESLRDCFSPGLCHNAALSPPGATGLPWRREVLGQRPLRHQTAQSEQSGEPASRMGDAPGNGEPNAQDQDQVGR